MRESWWKAALVGAVAAAAAALAVALLRGDDRAPAVAVPLLVGAVEDAAIFGDPLPKVDLARLAGFRALVFSARWTPPQERPTDAQLQALADAAVAARNAAMTPIVAVYQLGSATPLTDDEQAEFAAYAAAIAGEVPGLGHLIVGNEPNLGTFWRPQFADDGTSASAPAFLSLLARTYDAVKEVRPDIVVIGGGLAARGTDRADGRRPSQSPTAFIRALGAAYRTSGRDRPVMDMLSIHPYGEHSSIAPDLAHPNTSGIGIADYGKLVGLLGEAFDGTAQPGSDLPIAYGEYGIETTVDAHPAPYTGTEHATVRPVDPVLQGERYAQAIALAACQPTVRMLLLFHVSDEAELDRLQSGVYWADDTAKPSLETVREAIRAVPDERCREAQAAPLAAAGAPPPEPDAATRRRLAREGDARGRAA